MNSDSTPSDPQSALWNGSAGHAWVESQELLDQVFKPLEELLVESVNTASSRCVLDVGCGTGSTTVAIARNLAMDGCCVGLDISEPMIAAARVRAERERSRAVFIQDDAETRAFEPATFDLIVSRFGVMFFADSVRAFSNLRYAAREGAQLRFIAWRAAAENPFMTTAERAAAPLLANIPARDPDAPGQFAFADPGRVREILKHSGWSRIEIEPIETLCHFPEQHLVHYFTRLGPLGRVFEHADPTTRERIVTTVRKAFQPYVHGTEVRFTAACWDVRAEASDE